MRKQAPAATNKARAKVRAVPRGKHAAKLRPADLAALPSHGIAHALSEGDFKLMLDVRNDSRAALYDLKHDLAEQKNLIGEPSQAGRVKSMEAIYRAIRASKRSVGIIAAPSSAP